MIEKVNNPKDALIQSYNKPVAYKDYILYNGVVIVRWRKQSEKS